MLNFNATIVGGEPSASCEGYPTTSPVSRAFDSQHSRSFERHVHLFFLGSIGVEGVLMKAINNRKSGHCMSAHSEARSQGPHTNDRTKVAAWMLTHGGALFECQKVVL
jgi:hypothetical protein